MRGADRIVLIALPAVALVAAFWFLVLSPKREEAAGLEDDVAALETEVSNLEQTIAAGEEARREFPDDYQKVVVMGKAVPEDDDQASLFAQLSKISKRARVDFRTLELVQGGAGTTATPAATPTPPPAAPPAGEAAGGAAPTPASSPAPATEADAAALPIGATVGSAGLPVMPYDLQFEGDFFRFANFIQGLDRTVRADDGRVSVDGRLMTIDGFSFTEDPRFGFPFLLGTFAVSTYVTPPGQGLTAGATPEAPAPVTGSTAPVSTGTTASSSTAPPTSDTASGEVAP
jgi:hypothetical protein